MKIYEITCYIKEFLISSFLFTSYYNFEINKNNNILIKLSADNKPRILQNGNLVMQSGLSSFINSITNVAIFMLLIMVIIYVVYNIAKSDDDSPELSNESVIGGFFNKRDTKKVDVSSDVKFSDVAGLIEAKQEVERYVDIMKNREKYLKMGAKLPKGFLMIGPPGCGKTLLAKAIAGEAGVNFISACGSEFDEMYVGVGSSRVRNLFKKARENSPCIIFIDEIDGIGSKRGQIDNREHDKTLNNLLTEMDGFNDRDQVLCIGATNRVDILDPALTRSGRFDQQIVIDPPSIDGRKEIFDLYFKKLKLSEKINLDNLAKEMAKITPGVCGADIANICNQAAIIAVSEKSENVNNEHLKKAMEDILIGGQRKSRKISESEKKIVAYHECGHAILGYILKNAGSPLTISIIPRGTGNLGYTLPDYDDKMLRSKQELIEEIAALLGGTIAEDIFFSGNITGGASNDIEKATNIAYSMCTQYGMSSQLGKIQMAIEKGNKISGGPKMSSETMAKVDLVVKKLIDDIYVKAKDLMLKHKDDVIKLVEHLLEKEELKKDKTKEILGSEIANRYNLTIDF
jgi:ATP-dependent metalloprotease FtsH